jgi:hypothetical protein
LIYFILTFCTFREVLKLKGVFFAMLKNSAQYSSLLWQYDGQAASPYSNNESGNGVMMEFGSFHP